MCPSLGELTIFRRPQTAFPVGTFLLHLLTTARLNDPGTCYRSIRSSPLHDNAAVRPRVYFLLARRRLPTVPGIHWRDHPVPERFRILTAICQDLPSPMCHGEGWRQGRWSTLPTAMSGRVMAYSGVCGQCWLQGYLPPCPVMVTKHRLEGLKKWLVIVYSPRILEIFPFAEVEAC